jgi:hypothetical protein
LVNIPMFLFLIEMKLLPVRANPGSPLEGVPSC